MAAEAARFIRESERPFFLYFAPKAPHVTDHRVSAFSVEPAPRHVGAFAGLEPWRPPSLNEPNVSDKPRYIRRRSPIDVTNLAQLRQEQLESLLAVDDALAAMLAALEETGELADTLIVFTSDNGYAWGEHRWRQKVVPYEESLRVPLVVRWDALGLPPRTDARFALNIDLAPTIAAAVGIEAPGAEGRNLLPLLSGTDVSWRRRFLIERFGTTVVPPYCGFRAGRWKYVQYATGEEELYNLVTDPYERRNVSAVRPVAVDRYRVRVRRSACNPPGFEPLPRRRR